MLSSFSFFFFFLLLLLPLLLFIIVAAFHSPSSHGDGGAGLSFLDNEELTWGKFPLISGTYRKPTPNKSRRASGARHLVSIG